METMQQVLVDEVALLEQQVQAGGATRAVRARLERLKRERDRDSLGVLAKAFDDFEFRDGVLYRARLRPRAKLLDFAGLPPWTTLQVLEVGHNPLEGVFVGAFLNACPALHTVLGLRARQFPEVPCPRITCLELEMSEVPEVLAERFPSLRDLQLEYVFDAVAFWSQPFIQGLETVRLRSLTWAKGTLRTGHFFSPDGFVEWIEAGPALRRMELGENELVESGELYGLLEVLAAARRKGAEIVVVPNAPQ